MRLVDSVVQQIEETILAGHFKTGEKLPKTSDLQTILGASIGTIREAVAILEQKGLVARDDRGFAHIYVPAASRLDLVQQRLEDIADDYCEGASAPLILALVENGRFTPKEIAEFRRLVDQLENKSTRRTKRGRR